MSWDLLLFSYLIPTNPYSVIKGNSSANTEISAFPNQFLNALGLATNLFRLNLIPTTRCSAAQTDGNLNS